MPPSSAVSRSLQLLLRSSACLQQSRGFAIISLRHWLTAEQDRQPSQPSPPFVGGGLAGLGGFEGNLGTRYFADNAGRGPRSRGRRPGSQSSDYESSEYDSDLPGQSIYDLEGKEFEAALDALHRKQTQQGRLAPDAEPEPEPPEPTEQELRAAALQAEAQELAQNNDGALTPKLFQDLMEQGQPHEVIIKMAQRMGSILQNANFMDNIALPSEEEERKAQRRAQEEALQQQQQLRVPLIDSQGRAYGTGKRKCSIARVWIKPGTGRMTINGKALDAYFGQMQRRLDVLTPMYTTATLGAYDTYATVAGGGMTGQAQRDLPKAENGPEALRHGISKALQAMDPGHRPALRTEGLLTRDNRVVERKKPGKAKARKSFQWVKR